MLLFSNIIVIYINIYIYNSTIMMGGEEKLYEHFEKKYAVNFLFTFSNIIFFF